jgi:hypothetical protein
MGVVQEKDIYGLFRFHSSSDKQILFAGRKRAVGGGGTDPDPFFKPLLTYIGRRIRAKMNRRSPGSGKTLRIIF